MTTTTNNSSQVGFLLPVNENLKEGEVKGGEITKITLFEGPNIVGRNCIPVTDKRLSRKHITLDATNDGSAKVFVEGTNPVVIRGKDGRKKIASGETWRIQHGDVIELIPGHYFFKYVAKLTEKGKSTDNNQKRPFNEESNTTNRELVYTKKSRTSYEEESNTKIQYSGNGQKIVNSLEGIRNFNVSKENLPSTFRLMRVRELPPWANTNSVSISDIIQGNVVVAILSNYMVDMDWLLSACPKLTKVANALILHGEGDGSLEQMKRKKPGGWILHKPPLPISYGTHHSKAMFLIYPQGVRIVVHTANLISVDWNNKSQGLWMQDFPLKNQNSLTKPCGFETDLIDYLTALKWPEFSVEFPNMGTFKINPSFFKKFDYSNATVRLVASVPGYHSGPYLKKWGHMKLRTILQECTFDKEFRNSPLVYQFSSLGSLDEKWMSELASSMSSGLCEESKTPLGLGKPLIIWPTVENVRCSIEGYAAGGCIPSPQKNVEKDFLKKYWAKWKASHTGRCRAMPHIKTFTRYNGQNIAWFCLTSSNLSKAAWGALQKNNSQLMIRSYELGVLFLPGAVKNGREFSCTENGISLAGRSESRNCEGKRRKLVTLGWQGNKEGDPHEIIHLPVPYELPPKPYTSEDVPWCWDRIYTKKDVYGQVWPR